MNLDKNFFFTIAILILIVFLTLTIFSYRKRSVPGAPALAILLLAAMGYAVPYTLQMTSSNLESALIWYNLSLPGANLIAPAWLLFSLSWTNREKTSSAKKRKAVITAILLIPLLVCVAGWTNSLHNLYGSNFYFDTQSQVPALEWNFGLFYWLGFGYAYSLFTISSIIILVNIFTKLRLFFHQSILLLIGTLIPILFNIGFVLGVKPTPQLDITPYTFLLTGLIWTLAVFLFKLLNIVPIAHKFVFKQMQTGMIVMDDQWRVVDINPAALKLMDISLLKVIGRRLPGEFSACLKKNFSGNLDTKQEKRICLAKTEKSQFLDVQLTPFLDNNNEVIGYLFLFNDVSEQKHAEEALRESETKFRSLYESSPIGIMLFDAQGKFIETNRTALNMFGLMDLAPLKEANLFDHYHLNELMRNQLNNGKTVNYETFFSFEKNYQKKKLMNNNPGKIYINTLLTPLLDDHKQIEKYMLQLQDVTKNKQMEETLRYQNTHDALTSLYNRQFF